MVTKPDDKLDEAKEEAWDQPDALDRVWRFMRGRPYVWVPVAVVIIVVFVAVMNNFYNSKPIGTDPTTEGRPLSNPDQHLHSFAVDVTRPGVVFLGSHYGLFTSIDGGKSWPEPRGALNTLMITSLSPSTINGDTIGIVGTDPGGGNFGQNGIYITHDGGKNWTQALDPQGIPVDSQRYAIVAARDDIRHWYAIYSGIGLYETIDDGQNWQMLRPVENDKDAQRVIWSDPGNPQVMLLGGTLGLLMSNDGGILWNNVPAVIGGVYAIVASPANPNSITISTDDGAYHSTDAGATWTQISGIIGGSPFSRLAISQQNPQVIYGLVGQQIFRTTDGGADWTLQSQLVQSQPMALVVAPDNDQHVYVGFYYPATAFESKDGGKTWNLIAS